MTSHSDQARHPWQELGLIGWRLQAGLLHLQTRHCTEWWGQLRSMGDGQHLQAPARALQDILETCVSQQQQLRALTVREQQEGVRLLGRQQERLHLASAQLIQQWHQSSGVVAALLQTTACSWQLPTQPR